jgi:hypothetical protein
MTESSTDDVERDLGNCSAADPTALDREPGGFQRLHVSGSVLMAHGGLGSLRPSWMPG